MGSTSPQSRDTPLVILCYCKSNVEDGHHTLLYRCIARLAQRFSPGLVMAITFLRCLPRATLYQGYTKSMASLASLPLSVVPIMTHSGSRGLAARSKQSGLPVRMHVDPRVSRPSGFDSRSAENLPNQEVHPNNFSLSDDPSDRA